MIQTARGALALCIGLALSIPQSGRAITNINAMPEKGTYVSIKPVAWEINQGVNASSEATTLVEYNDYFGIELADNDPSVPVEPPITITDLSTLMMGGAGFWQIFTHGNTDLLVIETYPPTAEVAWGNRVQELQSIFGESDIEADESREPPEPGR